MFCKRLFLSGVLTLLTAYPVFAQIETERILIDGGIDAGFWIYVIDFDKDGDDDILASSLNSGLRWYQNDGAANFTKIDIDGSFKGAWSVHADDVDGDGDLDVIACSDQSDEVVWYRRDADDDFRKQVVDDNSLDPHSVYSADLDNDGDIDLMASVWEADQVVVFENDGQQNFDKRVIDGNFSSAHAIHAADMDNDGDIDILAGGGSKTALYENNGSGGFSRSLVAPFGAFGVHAADVNRDGLLDILRNERPDDNQDIDWLENNGDGTYTERTVEANYGESWAQAATDLDFDGDIDILAAGFVPNKVSYWLNNGNEGFSEEVLDATLTRPRCVALGDFDKDGDKDIAVITRNTDNLFWYKIAGSPGPQESITVTGPNGGEVFEGGTGTSITWSWDGEIDSVKVEYSVDNGASWLEITASTANNGNAPWTTPLTETTAARVRVSDTTDPATFDVSDSTFSIILSGLTLLSPNGGENWQGGTIQSISWTSIGSIDSIGLDYSGDLGASWNQLIGSAPNDGSYDWQVPDMQSNDALVRIFDVAGLAESDTSDGKFTIIGSLLTLTSPNGGEVWNGGTQQIIAWNTTGNIAEVNLDYSIDNGASWDSIATNVTNGGGFLWTVTDQQTDAALVRIADAADGVPIDQSDASFSIIGSSLEIASPNGGEDWSAGNTYDIFWISSGLIDSVKIEYSMDAGSTWNTITGSAVNSGDFEWTIPEIESQTALLRISDASDGVPLDVSDGVFTIRNGTLALTFPNGNEVWPANSQQLIAWTSTGTVDFVHLEYSNNSGASWETIAPIVANTGSFIWTVPNSATEQALVRVSDSADGFPVDRSDTLFTILGSGFTITAPNGGESFYSGTRQTIEWVTNGEIPLVKLVLKKETPDSIVIAEEIPNSGSYEWLVPNIDTDQARIWIYDAADNIPSDQSDNTFSISRTTLTLTAPNGGETWLGNSEQIITWETTGVVDSVLIEYSTTAGNSWESIAGIHPNSGNFTWMVPNSLSFTALVRVSNAFVNSISDVSDNTFTIISSSLTVTSPNGGEKWQKNSSQKITWHSTGVVTSVNLDYSVDRGASWQNIVTASANVGSFDWALPDMEADSVMIRVANAENGVPTDVSDDYFAIVSTVTSISSRGAVPEHHQLLQNYPNPFNMDTRIGFAVPTAARVTLHVYNIRGEHIIKLLDEELAPGEYSIPWNGQSARGWDLTSGIYIYSVKIGNWQAAKQLVLVK